MIVRVAWTDGTLRTTTVTDVRDVRKRGLYNPFTLAGDIVIFPSAASDSGIVASDQSEWFAEGLVPASSIPALYHTVLAPVRLLYAVLPSWVRRFDALSSSMLEHASKGSGAPIDSLDELG